MTSWRRLALGAVVGLSSLALLGAVLAHIHAIETGPELVFEVGGFDPRDFLRGHYVRLRYPDLEQVSGLAAAGEGRHLTVHLAPGPDGLWRPQDGSTDDSIAVVARIDPSRSGDPRYGIERFYAQQQEAEAIEDAMRMRGQDVRVIATVGWDRRLRIKALMVGDRRYALSWF